MKFVRETAKAWAAGLSATSAALTGFYADRVLTGPEYLLGMLAGAVAWFLAWRVPNEHPGG